MTRQTNLTAAWTAAVLCGCASGGGGSGGVEVKSTPIPRPTPTAEMRCFPLLPFICGWFEPGSNESTQVGFRSSVAGPTRAVPFTSWSELGALEKAEFQGIGAVVTYTQTASGDISGTSVTTPPEAQVLVRGSNNSAQAKFDGLDVAWKKAGDALQLELSANPSAQGWNYQSFGVWNNQAAHTGEIALSSFGAPTPASAVPLAGSATFVGKLGGFYVSPAGEGSLAAANLTLNADFSARSLNFLSSGSSVTRDLSAASPARHLDLNGTLVYAPGTNTFSGTLKNAGGTMSGSSKGQFYGPAAQELGGVFTVKSANTVETFSGAYGAKR
jgi:hypothetical protein